MELNTVTVRDLIQEARTVPVYRGDGSFELSHFIQEVETIINLLEDEGTKSYVFRIFITKIQGEAAVSIRRFLSDEVTWSVIKEQLIKTFGVWESFLKLKEKADSTKFTIVSQYYKDLLKFLDQLNLKYNLESNKPLEFRPIHFRKNFKQTSTLG